MRKFLAVSFLILCISIVSQAEQQSPEIFSIQTKDVTVHKLGDIEGMISRWDSFVEILVAKGAVDAVKVGGKYKIQKIRPGHRIEFHGDLMDRGDSGRELAKIFVELKTAQPEQMTILLGNRDLRHFQVLAELNSAKMDSEATEPNPIDEKSEDHKELFDRREYMKSGLAQTLVDSWRMVKFRLLSWGAKMQILELQKTDANAGLPDAYRTWVNDMKPDGLLGRYLLASQFIQIDVPTREISVHGAIVEENYGRIPWMAGVKFKNAYDWVKSFNTSGHDLIVKALNGDMNAAGQLALAGNGMGNKSIISARYQDDNGYPEAPSQEVLDWLMASGLMRTSSGHTPVGEHPVIIVAGGYQIVMLDLSMNNSGLSPDVEVKGDRLKISSQIPGEKPVEIDLRYSDKTVLGTVHDPGNGAGKAVVIGKQDGKYKVYSIGPKFSRLYGVVASQDLQAGTVGGRSGATSCKVIFGEEKPGSIRRIFDRFWGI